VTDRVQELEARVEELEAAVEERDRQLANYRGRGQKMLDGLATQLLEAMQENPSAATLNVVRQFLKDQNIIDLRGGPTPTGDLGKMYPFPSPQNESDDFGVKDHG